MKTFFVADTHYYHKNIIKYCDRPFFALKDMHSDLIANHNKVVGPEDRTFFIGDFAMVGRNGLHQLRTITSQLNGQKILILGNHDEMKPFKYIEAGFRAAHTSLETVIEGHKVVMNHDPCIACGIPNDSIFICGHTHNLFKVIPEYNTFCASVENINYTPINLEGIIGALKHG